MSVIDFDAIAEAVSPEQLARAIGAKPDGRDFHCPGSGHANGDRDGSLSINRKDGRTVAYCHGCGLKATPVQVAGQIWGVTPNDAAKRLVSELGITTAVQANGTHGSGLGELVATYDYTDEQGEYLFSARRFAFPKDFRQGRRQGPGGWAHGIKDVRRVLYRLPEVVEGVTANLWILVVEGEKDADALAQRELIGTCSPMGAGKWKREYSESLRGARVCILPDNDDPGRKHGQAVGQALHGIASEVRVLELPGVPDKGGDVSDWFGAGGTTEEFQQLVRDAPVWEPKVATVVATSSQEGRHLTDLGNAERLVRLHGDRIRYVREWGTWLVWDGTRWAKDRTGEVERLAQATVREMHKEALGLKDRAQSEGLSKHAYQSEREARIKSMVSLGRVMDGIPLVPEDLDSDPWLFNVLNGTIDLRTGTLQKHRQADGITKLAPVKFNPDARAKRWYAFLREVMGRNQDLVRFIQRAVGYSLTGTTTEHVLLFLYGQGQNGKTTLLKLLLDAFGDYGKQSEPELLLRKRGDAHPTGVADLQGSRLVATSEIDAGRHMAESLLKSLTGGDRITARFMRQNFFEFEPSHTIWLAANHRPVIKGTDVAIWRRIKLIPFDVVIPEQDRDSDLPEKLKAELPGILAWAVRGCLEWRKKGLAAPAEVTAATQSYRDDMDVVGEFIAEHCVLELNVTVSATKLYEKYKEWAEAAGERKLTQKNFGLRIAERGFEKEKNSKTRRWMYVGIGLGTPSETVRNSSDVSSSKPSHVETIVSSVSDCFESNNDADYERDEREGMAST